MDFLSSNLLKDHSCQVNIWIELCIQFGKRACDLCCQSVFCVAGAGCHPAICSRNLDREAERRLTSASGEDSAAGVMMMVSGTRVTSFYWPSDVTAIILNSQKFSSRVTKLQKLNKHPPLASGLAVSSRNLPNFCSCSALRKSSSCPSFVTLWPTVIWVRRGGEFIEALSCGS